MSSRTRKLVKWYLKLFSKQDRRCRVLFVGKNLKKQQYRWLHFTNHPWEDNKGD